MSFSSVWQDMKDSAATGMNAVVGAYAQGVENWAQAQAEQVGARFAPQVDYQNKGEPVSVKIATPQKELVGDSEAAAAVNKDKKLVWIAGGALVLVAVIGFAALGRRK